MKATLRHAAVLIVLTGAPAVAGEPCRIATQGSSPVAEACAKGGREAARKLMKAQMSAAKSHGGAFTCDGCHKNIDDYQLTASGRDDYAKLLALAGGAAAPAAKVAAAPAPKKIVAPVAAPAKRVAAPATKVVSAPAPKPTPKIVAKVAPPAPPAPAAIKESEPVEGVHEYLLANGLRLLLVPEPARATVTVTTTYLAGARNEGSGESGLARVLAGALAKGSPGHKEASAALEAQGARLVANAELDRTTYAETMPATAVNLQQALRFEADRMTGAHFEHGDLPADEADARDARAALETSLLATAFPRHAYGRAPLVAGEIAGLRPEAVRAFYETYYQPDDALVVVAGNFDVPWALALVQESLGALPRPTRALPVAQTTEPVQEGERSVTVRRPGDQAIVAVGYRGVRGADPDFVAEEAAVQILTSRSSGRLQATLVDKGLAVDLNGAARLLVEPGIVTVSAVVPAGRAIERAQATLASTIEGLARARVRADEVERWRARTLKELALSTGTSERIGAELGAWAALGDWRLFYLHRDRVRALRPTDVERVAAAYFKPANRTLGAFVPTKTPDRAPVPPVQDVAAMIRDHAWGPTTSEGEPFAATIDNAEDHLQRTTLGSGLQLALLAKKTRGQAVKLAMALHFGSETDLAGKTAAAELLAPLLFRGSRKHNRQQLEDELDRLKAEVRFERPAPGLPHHPGDLALAVTTVGESLPGVVQLLGEILREPAFAKAEWESLRREELARLDEQRLDPATLALVKNTQAIYPYAPTDVRYVPSVDQAMARLRAVKLADIAALHKNLIGASHAELAVVGDFDEAAVTRALDEAFGTWTSPRPWRRIVQPFKPGRIVDGVIDTPGEALAVVAVAQGIELGDVDPEYPAALLLNRILGGGAGSRLAERLGRVVGGGPGASSALQVPAFDRSGAFFVSATCAPQSTAKTMDALLEEMRRLATEEVSEAELERAKREHALGWDSVMDSDERLAGALVHELHLGRTLQPQKKINAAVAALTAADVKAAAKKYFQTARLARVRTTDLKVARERASDTISAQEHR